MSKVGVMVVDDSVVVRRLVSEALTGDPRLEVLGTASNGRLALAKIEQLRPDVVLLDLEMPEMGGLETLRRIREGFPDLRVVIFSRLTRRGAEETLDALTAGATDYVTKPTSVAAEDAGWSDVRGELVRKLTGLFPEHAPQLPPAGRRVARARPEQATHRASVALVVIGASTGGPVALHELLARLPGTLAAPVLVVQHMPPGFTRSLAARLDQVCPLRVEEAADGAPLGAGQVWIAPGGRHLEVEASGTERRLRIHDGPRENSCRPSVDVLFRSAAALYGDRCLAVVLTGMGRDGLRGCERLREANAVVLAQDRETSVVWGMPGAVAEAGLAEAVLPLTALGDEIARRVDPEAADAERASGAIAATRPGS